MSDDPYRYFRIEARELLDQLSQGVLDLEKSEGGGPGLVSRLLRVAHTLKGAARVVRQPEIADDAHVLEDVLQPYRQEPAVALPREAASRLLELVDRMDSRLAAITPPAEPGTATETGPRPVQEPAPQNGGPAPEAAVRMVRAGHPELDDLLDDLAETAVQFAAARRHAHRLERIRDTADLLADQLRVADARRRDGAAAAGDRRPVGDGAGAGAARAVAETLRGEIAAFERGLGKAFETTDRELRQARAAAERLRLVPARAIFTWLERAVRDVAETQHKRVRFAAGGSDVRLDGELLTEVYTALLHVVRNAVAHGVEPPAQRQTAGKPPEGQVTVQVVRRGRRVVFSCQDDGRGFDLDAVRDARAGGPAGAGTRPGDDTADLTRVFLTAGLSTAATVTEVAGRGIGLDVLREVAEKLGGQVGIASEPGRGATVTLDLPLSLVALDGLMVESGGVPVTIPLDSVRHSLRTERDQIAHTPDGDRMIHDGDAIPFVPLARALSRPGGAESAAGPAFGSASRLDAAGPGPAGRHWSAVVVEGGGGVAAIGVDRVVGTTSVVLRPLPDLAPTAAVVAGAALDADGSPRLVLDPDGLVAEARRAGPAPTWQPLPRLPILVIDDSLTTRMLEQSILESAGYEVDLATSGEEGMDAARRRRYGLFLVDVEMPGMDGFTFVERTRADPVLRETPAILVTSRASPEDRRRGEEAGARAYIVKGEFDQGEFLGQVRSLLG